MLVGVVVLGVCPLGLFLSCPDRPGGPLRTVEVGQPPDLVLLAGGLD
ncbi:MAG: hypothetical protein ACM30G_16185 [Micromonosporaceae bacterium]